MTPTGSVKDAVSREEIEAMLKEQRKGLTKTFNERFDAQDKRISDLVKKITQQNSTISDLGKKIIQLKTTISEKETTISEKNKTIAGNVKTISEQGEEINQLNSTISDLGKKIIQLETTISEKNKTIAGNVKTISEKDKTIAEKEETIAEKEETIAEKEKTIREKEKTIGEKEKTIGEKEKTIGEKEKTIAEKEIKETNYRNHIRDYTNFLNAKDKILTPFYFDSGEKSFKPQPYENRIKEIVSWLSKNPNIKLILHGYCDHYGAIEKNKDLGKKRAMFVKGLIEEQWKRISNEKSNQVSDRLEIISIGRTEDFDPERVSVNRQVMFVPTRIEKAGDESFNQNDNSNES